MELKKKAPFFFLIISFFLFSGIITKQAIAYPGWEGDCEAHHGIGSVISNYDASARIVLDGQSDEKFWLTYSNNKAFIPLATDITKSGGFNVTLNLTFVHNNNYLYILCEWEDNTTVPAGFNYDGLFFCWNIDVPNFTADFLSDMSTDHMGSGNIDSWNWIYDDDFALDKCFGEKGWFDSSLEAQDIEVAYSLVENESYTLEIRRALTTGDQHDVKFDKTGLYEFNLAILNDGRHENHAISWTYALNLKLPANEFPVVVVIVIAIVSIAGVVVVIGVVSYRKKRRN
ncbi:MAG: hypothetical protein JW891_12530 [Candidatus Lokiarchaeota archaeon]|nr:hypothetical protein [Candidatus Lokiarchaeota archaeon]